MGEEKFDIILSKDSFEHIAEPERFIAGLAHRLAKDGVIAIGFGPLWKSPYGGHIKFMTLLPWAHLLFPEWVIMEERRRFRPDEDVKSFSEIRGGLNKMTLKRCMAIMSDRQFECLFFKTNRYVLDESRVKWLMGKTCNLLRMIPFCRELFSINLYGIWRLRS
jgi:SAM-dependent methyltransferase